MAQRSARRDWENQFAPACIKARGSDLDPIGELPYGPAACEKLHQRPDTCQHPTTCCADPKDSSCADGGVHTWCKGAAEIAGLFPGGFGLELPQSCNHMIELTVIECGAGLQNRCDERPLQIRVHRSAAAKLRDRFEALDKDREQALRHLSLAVKRCESGASASGHSARNACHRYSA